MKSEIVRAANLLAAAISEEKGKCYILRNGDRFQFVSETVLLTELTQAGYKLVAIFRDGFQTVAITQFKMGGARR